MLDIYLNAKSWPFEEARKLLKRSTNKGYMLFETGYGPSGLPHIGTFGEVLRTTFVLHAFRKISDVPCKLFVFSDDMDGLRKVPTNVPNQELLQANLEKPLTSVPDPFEKFDSFAGHNNAMLREFLDSFGFEYEFKSSTHIYKSGEFNKALRRVLECYDQIMEVMLPSLRDERRQTYSPFLPISERTGQVLQVRTEEVVLEDNSIIYKDPELGEYVKTSVLEGRCKLQWKVDWGMRWHALGVDYEMSGKDLIDSVKLSSKICKILGGNPPDGINYELFLDEEGKKISKSKGNGISMNEWLRYAPQESLSYYMYQNPKRAKRLYFDVIPLACDEYIDAMEKYWDLPDEKKMDSPIFHIHDAKPPRLSGCPRFSMLLNLVQACSTDDEKIIFNFVAKYVNEENSNDYTREFIKEMIDHAILYYKDFAANTRKIKQINPKEKDQILDLLERLKEIKDEKTSAEDLQGIVFEIGKKYYTDNIKNWFGLLYGVLFGVDSGPKLGSFIDLYGIKNTIRLLEERIS